jgi:hypothetical protein
MKKRPGGFTWEQWAQIWQLREQRFSWTAIAARLQIDASHMLAKLRAMGYAEPAQPRPWMTSAQRPHASAHDFASLTAAWTGSLRAIGTSSHHRAVGARNLHNH